MFNILFDIILLFDNNIINNSIIKFNFFHLSILLRKIKGGAKSWNT